MPKSFTETMDDSRIIFLKGEITPDVADSIIAQLLYLDSLNHEDINIYINSPGGSVADGLAIIDTMEYIDSKVNTIAIGTVASMAAVILSCGDKRFALKHARMMLHQVYAGMQGTLSDISITYRNMQDFKNDIMNILVEKTGRNKDKLERDCDRDYWLNSVRAKEYGLIDEVICKPKTVQRSKAVA